MKTNVHKSRQTLLAGLGDRSAAAAYRELAHRATQRGETKRAKEFTSRAAESDRAAVLKFASIK